MRHIPNFITCLNLLSGCVGVVFAFNGSLKIAGIAIVLSAFFDFFDGMAARVLKHVSPIGKQLDSLADVVSFGFLPSCILFQLIRSSLASSEEWEWLAYAAFIITIFSALRLAKFNIDTRQAEHFIGLPTPSSALVILSIPYIISAYPHWDWLSNHWTLIGVAILLSALLVAELPLLSLKFKSFDIQSNLLRYILLMTSLILIVFLTFAAIPLIIGVYIVISIIHFNR